MGKNHLKQQITNSYSTSLNWSGYELTSTPSSLDWVEDDWIVPSITCDSSSDYEDASVWVGLGSGDSSSDPLYQTGISMVCDDGTVSYTPWWEEYPENSQQSYTYSHTISAGDKIVAYAMRDSNSEVTLHVYDYGSNLAQDYPNWTDTENIYETIPTPSQEECVLERPTINGNYAVLPDFVENDFSTQASGSPAKACDVVANDTDHIISSSGSGLSGIDRMDMVNSSSTTLVETSTQTGTGSYHETWDQAL